MITNANKKIIELQEIIERKEKIIKELYRDMRGMEMELNRLEERVKELEGRS